MNIFVTPLNWKPSEIEIVERKGIGHPDTICDSIAEKISINLAKLYLKKFGAILHYNVDKAFLSAGEAKTKFGGGRVIKPMKLFLGDRATYCVENEELPIGELVEASAREWIKENLRFVKEKDLLIVNEIKQGSEELTSIFKRKSTFLPANDTSALVGYAPMTKLEESVYKIERYLNSKEFKKEFPETGEDVKVMGLRVGDNFSYIIAVAFVDSFIKDEPDYFRKKREVLDALNEYVKKEFDIKASIKINTLDEEGKGEDGCYLTVTGTSAESGDSGEVGRGNRVNGVIALNRPAGSEAAAGKNTVSHVGKIYNVLAFEIAKDIYKETGKANYVWLLSQIGLPVNKPFAVSVQVDSLAEGDKKVVSEIVERRFGSLDRFIKDLTEGKYSVC